MSPIDRDRFGLGAGRKRPPYQPMDIHCPNCGAGLTVRDEQTEMIVCDHCGSKLDISENEKKVLGKGADRKFDFPLQIGDGFRYKGSRYEVIARMAFIEDDDYSEMSRQYLLFHPRRGTLWLDEYQGSWSLSYDSFVMPADYPFAKSRGDLLKTYDGKEWVCEGVGMYELVYVDGALPWIAKIGDRINYAEFSAKNGSGEQYEAQLVGTEVEYGTGSALRPDEIRAALGKKEIPLPAVEKIDAAGMRNWFWSVIAMAVVALVFNGILALMCMNRGTLALEESFPKSRLTAESMTKPFQVASDGDIIKVTAQSPGLDNAWMAVDLAVVEGDDKVLHVFDNDIEYYHGVEGGESWSEGSKSGSSYIKIPKAGNYRLLVKAVSAYGEALNADKPQHDLNIRVTDGALMPHFFIVMAIVSALILGLGGFAYRGWKNEEDDDEDD